MISIGKNAPDFCRPIVPKAGGELCLKDLRGKWVAIFFYVKDNTSG